MSIPSSFLCIPDTIFLAIGESSNSSASPNPFVLHFDMNPYLYSLLNLSLSHGMKLAYSLNVVLLNRCSPYR